MASTRLRASIITVSDKCSSLKSTRESLTHNVVEEDVTSLGHSSTLPVRESMSEDDIAGCNGRFRIALNQLVPGVGSTDGNVEPSTLDGFPDFLNLFRKSRAGNLFSVKGLG